MKRERLQDLARVRTGHFLRGVVPGEYLCAGGISFKKPGQRSHPAGCTCSSCDGKGRHVHPGDREIFVILQGRGVMEVDGVAHPVETGDIVICEPGEDHHLVADEKDPCVNLWLHAGPARHPDQAERDKEL